MYCSFDHTFFGSPCIENCLYLVLKYKNCRVFKNIILSHELFFLLKLKMSKLSCLLKHSVQRIAKFIPDTQ